MINPWSSDLVYGANVAHLPWPGQQSPLLPIRELLGSAPWVFLVYQAFLGQWTPPEIILLVLVLTPIVVLTTRYKKV